jgi:hypothetical protein
MRCDCRIDNTVRNDFRLASVRSSSCPIKRLYPATSAASTAANRRFIRSAVKKAPTIGNSARMPTCLRVHGPAVSADCHPLRQTRGNYLVLIKLADIRIQLPGLPE